MENRISPGALIMWIIIALIVGGLIGYYIPRSGASYDESSERSVNVNSDTENAKPVSVTREGKYVCLPHRDQSGPTTQECAFGLQTTEGIYYALDASRATFPNTISTGDSIKVTGTIETGGDTDTLLERYAIIGVINVDSVEEVS